MIDDREHKRAMATWLDSERRAGAPKGRLQAIEKVVKGEGPESSLQGLTGRSGALDALARTHGTLAECLPTVDDEVSELRRSLVDAAIPHLPARDRRLLDLRHRLGLTQVEAAERLGVCQPSVSKAEARALHRLKYFTMWSLTRGRIDPALRALDVSDEARLAVSRYLAGETIERCGSHGRSTNASRIAQVRELAEAGGSRTAILVNLIDARRAVFYRLSHRMPRWEQVIPRRELFALAG